MLGTAVLTLLAGGALGDPKRFTFTVAAARESSDEAGGGIDVVPKHGTHRYTLSG